MEFGFYSRSHVRGLSVLLTLALVLAGCRGTVSGPDNGNPSQQNPSAKQAASLVFGPEVRVGHAAASPASPFLRVGPDGKLYAIWTEQDQDAQTGQTDGTSTGNNSSDQGHSGHGSQSSESPAGMRAAFMAVSADGGQTWSTPQRVNDQSENVQGDENLPKLAFGGQGQIYATWSIPNAKGDKMRANIRFSHMAESGQFMPAVTLNEIPDIARFPALEVSPDGTVFVVWIDRRADKPAPRAIYLTRMDATGKISNAEVGGPSCECCRVTIAFAEGGKRVHIAYRQKTENNIRDIVVQTSTDGGATFGAPVVISNDGWHLEACPHAGPVLGTDARGNLHVTWFTQGSKPEDAGVYYTVSRDGGRSFAPRQVIHPAGGPGVLHSHLAVGEQGEVYVAWDNFQPDKDGTQIFFRHLAADGETLSPEQQISQAEGNTFRPSVALSKEKVFVAWTEAKGEQSWIVTKAAPLSK